MDFPSQIHNMDESLEDVGWKIDLDFDNSWDFDNNLDFDNCWDFGNCWDFDNCLDYQKNFGC